MSEQNLVGGKRDTLRMVARRGGEHPTRELLARKLRHLVVGAAQLEREHRLVVLTLQINPVVQPGGKIRREIELGLTRHVVDTGSEDAAQVVVAGGVGHGAAQNIRLAKLADAWRERRAANAWPSDVA